MRWLYEDATIPEATQAYELANLHDLRHESVWPPSRRRMRHDQPLATGMLAAGLRASLNNHGRRVIARLWVYCGLKLWLPVSSDIDPAENHPGAGLRVPVARAAMGWCAADLATRAFTACVHALVPLLRAHQLAPASDLLAAIEHIQQCCLYLPQGSYNAMHLAEIIIRLQTSNVEQLLQQHVLVQYAAGHLANTARAAERYPLLELTADQLGLRLGTPANRPAGPQAAPPTVTRTRAIRLARTHGEDEKDL